MPATGFNWIDNNQIQRSSPVTIGMPGHGIFGTGTQPTSSSQSTQNSQSSSYFSNPNLVNAVAGNMAGVQGDAAANYMKFLMDPTSSPLFQNALGGLLGSLVPSENAARMNLNDQFRAAGNTASSTYAHGASGLESDLMRNRQTMASQLLTSLFPQMAQALFAPMSQTNGLIDALKLQQASSTGQSTSTATGNTGNPNAGNQSFTGFQNSPWPLMQGGNRIV